MSRRWKYRRGSTKATAAAEVTSARGRRVEKAPKSKQGRCPHGRGRHGRTSDRTTDEVKERYGGKKKGEVASAASASSTASASALQGGGCVCGHGVGRLQKEEPKLDTEGREENMTGEGKDGHEEPPTALRIRLSLRSMLEKAR